MDCMSTMPVKCPAQACLTPPVRLNEHLLAQTKELSDGRPCTTRCCVFCIHLRASQGHLSMGHAK